MTIRRTFAAALAATAIASPAASAQPADLHASTALAAAQIQEQHDLRSPDAIDAAIHSSRSSSTVPASPGHPSESANTAPLPPATDEALSTSHDGVDWATLGLGIAGLVLFMGGVVALATRTRPASRTRASA
jgi:hypothetical protein